MKTKHLYISLFITSLSLYSATQDSPDLNAAPTIQEGVQEPEQQLDNVEPPVQELAQEQEPAQDQASQIDQFEQEHVEPSEAHDSHPPDEASTLERINNRDTKKYVSATELEEDATIELQFENADLETLITQISELFDITFISDDSISPLPQGSKSVKGNKISFKTQVPLTKKQTWNLFLTFLDIAGFAVVPESDPRFARITTTKQAQRSPITSFIGVSPDKLPDNDQMIRYLYFVQKGSLESIDPVVQAFRSSASTYLVLKDLNAFLLTDKASNIKSLMEIIVEFDRSIPQSISVLKLRRANAQDVKNLYDALIKTDDKTVGSRLFPAAKKQSSSLYFPDNVRLVAEPRTNTLIILGPQEAITKVESFVLNNIDVELGQESRSPLHIYPLKYADARTVASVLSDVTKFGKNTAAGKIGGVRDGDKYLKSLVFTAEPSTNRLIIRGDHEDFLQIKDVIAQLDEPQPQISIQVLILTIDISDKRALGVQLRSKTDNTVSHAGGHSGLTGTNVKFQTSGLNFGAGPSGFVTRNTGQGVDRLLGDLINLASGAGIGNIAVTLGADAFGVWGIFNALSTISNTQIVSNPFLTVANKQKAKVEVGTTRRVVSAQVISGLNNSPSFTDDTAALIVNVIPQINSDGMIVLDLDITISDFLNQTDPTSATKFTKQVQTKAVLADKEVLALGGLIKNRIDTSSSRTPVLGNIPILGWLFKNKQKEQTKENLLILISTEIIPAESTKFVTDMTRERIDGYHGTLNQMIDVTEKRDPVHRYFFKADNQTEDAVDDFLFNRKKAIRSQNKERRGKKKRKKTDPRNPGPKNKEIIT